MIIVSHDIIRQVYNHGYRHYPWLVHNFHENYELLIKLYYKDIYNISI